MRFNDDELARFNIALAAATTKLVEIWLRMAVSQEDVFRIEDQLHMVLREIENARKEVDRAIDRTRV